MGSEMCIRDRDPAPDQVKPIICYYVLIIEIGVLKPCRPAGRPAGRLGPNSRPERPNSRPKRTNFRPETKRPNSCWFGAATLSFRNRDKETQHSPLLAAERHNRLRSSGGATALFSVRNTALLWWDRSTLLCSQHRTPLVGLQHSSLFGVLQYFFLCPVRGKYIATLQHRLNLVQTRLQPGFSFLGQNLVCTFWEI